MRREELEARSQTFAVAVFALGQRLRAIPGASGPAGQLVDAATSVGANYRATSRSRSRAEFVAKLAVVVEEADEAVYWLEFVGRTGAVPREAVEPLLGEARELRAIFAAGYRTARSNTRRRNVRE